MSFVPNNVLLQWKRDSKSMHKDLLMLIPLPLWGWHLRVSQGPTRESSVLGTWVLSFIVLCSCNQQKLPSCWRKEWCGRAPCSQGAKAYELSLVALWQRLRSIATGLPYIIDRMLGLRHRLSHFRKWVWKNNWLFSALMSLFHDCRPEFLAVGQWWGWWAWGHSLMTFPARKPVTTCTASILL